MNNPSTLKGTLSDTGLMELCQILSSKTGCLVGTRNEVTGRVYFNRGNVVHATLGEWHGKDAFLEMCRWSTGTFDFFPGALPNYVSLSQRTDPLLMDAALYRDIWQDLEGRSIHENSVMEWVGYEEERADAIFDKPVKVEIWNFLESPNTVATACANLRKKGFSKEEVSLGLHSLVEQEVVRPRQVPASEPFPITPSVSLPPRPRAESRQSESQPNRMLIPVGIAAALVVVGGAAFLLLSGSGETATETVVHEVREQPAPGKAPELESFSPSAASAESVLAAEDLDAIMAAEGRMKSVRGTIVRAAQDPNSGIAFLNFDARPRQGFVAVVFPDSLEHFGDLPQLKEYEGREVIVTGLIDSYRGNPQIVLREMSQLQTP